jgi:hypothetical protein
MKNSVLGKTLFFFGTMEQDANSGTQNSFGTKVECLNVLITKYLSYNVPLFQKNGI